MRLLKANEGEHKCLILKMLKFTPKVTNTRVIQYQGTIFAKWKSLAQFLLLTLYSPVAFWLFYFLSGFGTVSKTSPGFQALVAEHL